MSDIPKRKFEILWNYFAFFPRERPPSKAHKAKRVWQARGELQKKPKLALAEEINSSAMSPLLIQPSFSQLQFSWWLFCISLYWAFTWFKKERRGNRVWRCRIHTCCSRYVCMYVHVCKSGYQEVSSLFSQTPSIMVFCFTQVQKQQSQLIVDHNLQNLEPGMKLFSQHCSELETKLSLMFKGQLSKP